jgi:hypothetical protein
MTAINTTEKYRITLISSSGESLGWSLLLAAFTSRAGGEPLALLPCYTAQSMYRLGYPLAKRNNVTLIAKNTSKVLIRGRRTQEE